MNYVAFQRFREGLLRERGDVVDCGETNLYRALARLIPPASPASPATVHRCHLAAEWVDRFGLSPDTTSRALVSGGVRDSLARLFRHYAGLDARIWLPSDNYPVYGELARAAGVTTREFSTLPEPVWPDGPPAANPELLLVTNPLKPLGRFLTADDLGILKRWLSRHPARRLLLDVVYTFRVAFHPGTLELLATGQCILLHSLTKGWLQPRLFGVAVVPEADAAALTPAFRAQSPPQENLERASAMMREHAGMPAAVAGGLQAAEERLRRTLSGSGDLLPRTADGYFLMVPRDWKDLLSDEKILGLPGTAFGSSRGDITILSTLAFCS